MLCIKCVEECYVYINAKMCEMYIIQYFMQILNVGWDFKHNFIH